MGEITTVISHILLFIALYFEVILLLTFFERNHLASFRTKEVASGDDFLPSVSIMVPCYNEEKTVGKTVESILALDYPKDRLSVLIVDDGSTDGTWNTVQAFQNHPQVRLLRKENGGKHTALNHALSEVKSELVGCLDADSFVAKNALREIVRSFKNEEVMAVTPAIKIEEAKTVVQFIQKAEYAMAVFMRRVFALLDSVFITPGPFSIFRKSVFDKLGPYREAHNTEDMEIALRMQQHHMKIINVPSAHIYTNAPRSLRALYKQRVRWTYGFLKNATDYRTLFFNKNYGNLGLFVLPFATLMVLPALFFTGLLLYMAAARIAEKYVEVEALGWSAFSIPSFAFEWFFVNTSSFLLLTYILMFIILALIAIGKRLSDDRFPSVDIFFYFVLYGFIAPLWLARSVYNYAAGRERSWAGEIDARRRLGE